MNASHSEIPKALLCSGRLMPQMQFVVGFGFCLFVCFYFKPHTEMKREGGKKPPPQVMHLQRRTGSTCTVRAMFWAQRLRSPHIQVCLLNWSCARRFSTPTEPIFGRAALSARTAQPLPHPQGSLAEGSVGQRGAGKWGPFPRCPLGPCRGGMVTSWGTQGHL